MLLVVNINYSVSYTMSSSDPDSITSQTTGAGGSAIIGIVLGILAGVFVILALLSMYGQDLARSRLLS